MNAILVGVNDSTPSDRALDWALREAHVTHQEVLALTVWQLPPGPLLPLDLGMQTTMWDGLPEIYQRVAEDAAVAAQVRGSGLDDVLIRAAAAEGDAGSVLVARAASADLLVVGRHSKPTLGYARLGSVTTYCLWHSPSPVVVVPPDWEPAPDGLPLVVGVDGSKSSANALRWAARRARERQHRLLVLWCSAGVSRTDIQWEAHRQWVEVVLRSTQPVQHELLDEVGEPTVLLRDHEGGAALLVLGSRDRGSLARVVKGSVSAETALHGRCPVVVVPETLHVPASVQDPDRVWAARLATEYALRHPNT